MSTKETERISTKDSAVHPASSVRSVQFKNKSIRKNSHNTVKIMFITFAVVIGFALAAVGGERQEDEEKETGIQQKILVCYLE